MKKIWVIEYSYFYDAFGVQTLEDHIALANRNFQEKKLHPYSIIGFFSSEKQCREECSVLQENRNNDPIPTLDRLETFQSAVDTLKLKVKSE